MLRALSTPDRSGPGPARDDETNRPTVVVGLPLFYHSHNTLVEHRHTLLYIALENMFPKPTEQHMHITIAAYLATTGARCAYYILPVFFGVSSQDKPTELSSKLRRERATIDAPRRWNARATSNLVPHIIVRQLTATKYNNNNKNYHINLKETENWLPRPIWLAFND